MSELSDSVNHAVLLPGEEADIVSPLMLESGPPKEHHEPTICCYSSESSANQYGPLKHGPHYWDPGGKQTEPILGIVALLITILSMLTSLAILIASNGRPVKSWTVLPTV